MPGVDGGEETEVVSALGGGEGDAGVAEKQGEDRWQGGPHDEGRDGVSSPLTEGGSRDFGHETASQWRFSMTWTAASCMEGSAERFITMYNVATNRTESRIARGMVFSGCFTSLPRNVML